MQTIWLTGWELIMKENSGNEIYGTNTGRLIGGIDSNSIDHLNQRNLDIL